MLQVQMASIEPQLHFVLFPLMAPGHMLPMIDLATILAHSNMIVTVVTTPHNASRFSETFARASQHGLNLRLALLQFPSKDTGFPEGCENFDMLPSMGMGLNFFAPANTILHEPAEKMFEELTPKPNCIISDFCFSYTAHIAKKFNIPRISFYGVSCFCLVWLQKLSSSKVVESVATDSEYLVIPNIPDKIEVTKAQIPLPMEKDRKNFAIKIAEAEMLTYGVVVNSFEELEETYVRDFKKDKNDKVWCVGPVSLTNKEYLDRADRGNKVSSDAENCMKWLDLQKQRSVIYACLGSVCNLTPLQFIELGMALEACKRPFIWVIREKNQTEELNEWIMETGFEEKTKGLGLLIRGWAPQVLILSHLAIGGFLTHCGWNSTLEAICAGVPLLTWPLFGDQFFNEKFAVHVLGIGVSVGGECPLKWGEEEKTGVLVKREDVVRGIEKLMDEGNESEERRKRVRELAEMAKRAVEEGGASHFNVTQLIQDIRQYSNKNSEQ
ncbi:UDP-glycosyltransferase 73C1-like [Abrus precatorius]|uniref:Glycosyltransferase n=1 Tax=Abrus precatorius TaxID=3816 RepID=A0A8B8LBL6_ABRPR|nr:UDP-glycosyltransferase 73C1-like [Abrus precatorius]